MNYQKYLKYVNVWVLIALAISLMGIVAIGRCMVAECYPPGPEYYDHISIAEQGDQKFDQNIVTQRHIYRSPHTFIIDYIDQSLYVPVSMLLAALAIWLYHNILRRHILNKYMTFIIIIMTICTPNFIQSFSRLDKFSTLSVLMLLFLNVFLSRKWPLKLLSIVILALISMYGVYYFIFVSVVLYMYSVLSRKQTSFVLTMLSSSIIMLMLYQYGFPLYLNNLHVLSGSVERLSTVLYNLGGTNGFSIFHLILCIIGLNFTWKNKSRYYLAYFIFIIAMVMSLYYTPDFNPLVSFGISFFAGVAFYRIILMEWSLLLIRQFSIYIIGLGLLFVSIASANHIIQQEPQASLIDSMQFFDQNQTILSAPQYGSYIKTLSGKIHPSGNRVVTDAYSKAKGDIDALNDTDTIFRSRNLDITLNLLKKYHVNYILMTDQMLNGQVWTEKDEGLLFLLSNQDYFNKEYHLDGIQIWRVSLENQT
ncbi:hypothetical protein K9M79_00760 [Candidatus Woesearchaeota archaeon]|nr:hypothetical protein [Candidatus Woesearchaeota archaeon]